MNFRMKAGFQRCVPLFIYTIMQINTHKYGHGEMRNRENLINRGDVTQGWQFSSLQYRLGKGRVKKRKSKLLQHGVFVFGHSSKY